MWIPIDLIIEILLRLPVNSIARCRCVSKLWATILSRTDFTELFLTRSLARPKLLFACRRGCETLFFSSPQRQNPVDDEKSPPVVVSYHMKFSAKEAFIDSSCPVNGLICLRYSWWYLDIMEETVLVICNPSTGQSLRLPKKQHGGHSLFGYDPIDKQFKVLTLRYNRWGDNEHLILTLGTGNMSWRMIQCCRPHDHFWRGICINGVLYYNAKVSDHHLRHSIMMLVCFDVRSEEFRFINKPAYDGTLINYNGKLGLFSLGNAISCDRIRNMELWVLEDAGKQEWSKNTYLLPAMWQNIVGNTNLRFVGMTLTKEFVFQSMRGCTPFYLVYYNIERNTVKKVELQGMEMSNNIHTFVDHVENVTLMQII